MASTLATGVACWPAPSQSVTPGRALFAKGLAKGCTSAHLQAIFSQFGTVTDCQIARHRSGRSAGFAIVTFLRHEEAVAAMQTVDNMMFMGRRLSVKWFSPERALEGSSHGVDALNMQALQHALQLTQLQPTDLMAQLAQMLESPRLAPQQPQNPHVAAWLDNFILAQQRDSPLAQPNLHDPSQAATPIDLLNFSALSLVDVPGAAALGLQQPPPGMATHPATPSALDMPDGAVFVTATSIQTGAKGAGGNVALGHSRLSKWCTAPGSAGGRSSAAQSFADDASSASETASVHASDDSSIATTTLQIPHSAATCEPPSGCCTTEGTSPAMLPAVMATTPSDPGSNGGVAVMQHPSAAAHLVVAATTATSSPVRHSPGKVAPAGLMSPNHQLCGPLPSGGMSHPSEVVADQELLRSRALAAAAAVAVATSRPGGVSSDPGALNPPMMVQRKSGPSFSTGTQQQQNQQQHAILPGAPPLAPLRTAPSAPAPTGHLHGGHHHHHHHHHGTARSGTQSARQSTSMVAGYNSCPGGGPAATPVSSASAAAAAANAGPDASLQQAIRLQQALAEQARTMSAQQQYVDALAKLAAARDQVMAAASLLTSSSGGGGLPLPSGLTSAHLPPAPAAGLLGQHHHHHAAMGGAVNPFMTTQAAAAAAAAAPNGVPDISALLMLQNAAAINNRALY